MSAPHRAARRALIAAGCYLAAGVAGVIAASRLASPDNRTAALVVGWLAGVVVVWLGSLVAMERASRKAGPPARTVKDPYYANLAAFVYGRGGNTRRLVVVLIVVVTVGLAIDLLAAFG
jgi:hypothetical protein